MDAFSCASSSRSGLSQSSLSLALVLSRVFTLVSSEIKLLTKSLASHHAVFGETRYLAVRRVVTNVPCVFTNVPYTHGVMVLWVFRRIIDTTVPWPGMHSDPIRSSALIYLALASTYILSPYVSICFLASCFIYYIHIDITSISILIL